MRRRSGWMVVGLALASTGVVACGTGDDRNAVRTAGPAQVDASPPAPDVIGSIQGDRLLVAEPSVKGGRRAAATGDGALLLAPYDPVLIGFHDSAFVTPDGSTAAYLSWEPTEAYERDPFATTDPDLPPNHAIGSSVLHLVAADGTPIAEVGGVSSFALGADGRLAYAATEDPMTYNGITNDSHLAVRTADGETITIEDDGHSLVGMWLGDALLYTTSAPGTGGETPAPTVLRSYDLGTGARSTLGRDLGAWLALNEHQMLGFRGGTDEPFANLVVWDTRSEELTDVSFDEHGDLRTTGPRANLGNNRFVFEFTRGQGSQQYVAVLAVEGSAAVVEVAIPVDLDRVDSVDALGVGPDGTIIGWGSKTTMSGDSGTTVFVAMTCDLVEETCTYGDDQDEIPPTALSVARDA